jgi:hypothetical protein
LCGDDDLKWGSLSPTSPLLIEVDGQPQVVALLASEGIGFDPENGQMLATSHHFGAV